MRVTKTKSVNALSRQVTRPVPENWGKSELSKFLDLAETQMVASYAIVREWVDALEEIDDHLPCQAPTFFHEIDRPRQSAANLFMRAFGTFRAACRLALSGQMYEVTVLTRSIIESAVYAWVCATSEEHRNAWEARERGDEERKAARRMFTWGGLLKRLEAADPRLAERIQGLYEQSIDQGAHPNIGGIDLSLEVNHVDGDRHEMGTIFIHGGEAILAAIVDLIHAMSLVYQLLMLTIGDRLRILNIDRKVEAQHRRALELFEAFKKRINSGDPL